MKVKVPLVAKGISNDKVVPGVSALEQANEVSLIIEKQSPKFDHLDTIEDK